MVEANTMRSTDQGEYREKRRDLAGESRTYIWSQHYFTVTLAPERFIVTISAHYLI
jgi:hypothetical protein